MTSASHPANRGAAWLAWDNNDSSYVGHVEWIVDAEHRAPVAQMSTAAELAEALAWARARTDNIRVAAL